MHNREFISNKTICLPDGTKLDWFNKDYSMFLNKSIILYGLSGSGKSSIIINILYTLRNHISYPFIITKSMASAEKNYIGRVPRGCIKWNLTKQWLEEFIVGQSARTKVYEEVNALHNLKETFDHIDNKLAVDHETCIINNAERCIHAIEQNTTLSYPDKKQLLDDIKKTRNDALIHLYKTFIRAYRVELEQIRHNLSPSSRRVITFLDFMPHALLVFDDCAHMIKTWVKESPAIKELFYQGRHIHTTIILGTQADKEIDSEIRKNARISIFTTAQDTTGAFSRAANAFPERDRKRASICANAIFSSNLIGSRNTYQKLVYVRDDPIDPFKYTIADVFEDDEFKIGSNCVWELDKYLYPDHNKSAKISMFDKYT